MVNLVWLVPFVLIAPNGIHVARQLMKRWFSDSYGVPVEITTAWLGECSSLFSSPPIAADRALDRPLWNG